MIKLLIILNLLFISIGCSTILYIPILEGDCVDRVVELKSKMQSEGYEVKVILGIQQDGEKRAGHAWIRYKDKKTGEWKVIKNY